MEEGGGLDELDGMEVFEVEEMGIAGNDVMSLTFEASGEELVIGGITGEAIGSVQVLGKDRLTKHQAKEASDRLCLWVKPALDVGRGQHMGHFPQDCW